MSNEPDTIMTYKDFSKRVGGPNNSDTIPPLPDFVKKL